MKPALYRLAVLYDPKAKHPPSNLAALKKLKVIAKQFDIDVQFLTPNDLKTLPLFHGLFIRAETRSHLYSYRWAELAEGWGLDVIDTTRAILLGCNKELQYELFKKHGVPIPKTQIIFEFEDVRKVINQLPFNFPLVVKIPEGAWSSGVFKVKNKKECIEVCKRLLKKNFSLILQEYLYTKFDWRIGIVNHEIIYACKYFMVKDHWQIIKRDKGKILDEGEFETVPIKNVPSEVIHVVQKIIPFLDHSLYGIDLKTTKDGTFAIEINDNPNIYTNVEDKFQPELYAKLLEAFVPNLIDSVQKQNKKTGNIRKRQLTEV